MANRSYLCGTNKKTTYPSLTDPDYDPDEQIIASDVWCVPLLWGALFRSGDVVRQLFNVDGQTVTTEAPITTHANSLRQLSDALPYFNRLFAAEGPLDEYAAFLRAAIEAAGYKYLTVELQEIASLACPEQEFYDTFRSALTGIGTDYSPGAKARWARIAQFRNLSRFPPARLRLGDAVGQACSEDDSWNHCRVCGAGVYEAGIGREVPWEPVSSSSPRPIHPMYDTSAVFEVRLDGRDRPTSELIVAVAASLGISLSAARSLVLSDAPLITAARYGEVLKIRDKLVARGLGVRVHPDFPWPC